jgi:hypothetical protein
MAPPHPHDEAPSAYRSRALSHLQTIKPGDGWSLQESVSSGDGAGTVRLCRRNLPLTDNSFVDLYFDGTDVVGLLSRPAATAAAVQAQILVDAAGRPVRGIKLKSVRIDGTSHSNPNNSRRVTQKPAAAVSSASFFSREEEGGGQQHPKKTQRSAAGTWTPEQHKQLWQLVGGFVIASAILRILSQALLLFYAVVLPLLYFHLLGTCPRADSFEAKRELKRVLRGAHLPDNHPDKPRGVLGEAVARVQASVAAELVATLPGYEVTFTDLLGAATVACVRVPTARRDFYWCGALNHWYYVCSTEVADKSD